MTMDELQYIVGRLKDSPFNINIRAVDFEEKTPDDQLQILNDVLSSLNAEMKVNIRVASRDQIIESLFQFLFNHKCKLIPLCEDDRIEWYDNLIKGNRQTIRQILYWVLSNYEYLCKRSYLANFLIPIDVPPEYLPENPNLAKLVITYKELQSQFIEIHKRSETIESAASRPLTDIVYEMKKLEQEKQQLLDQLERERMNTSKNVMFKLLIEESSKLRKCQNDEIRLRDQQLEQNYCMASTNQWLLDARQYFENLQRISLDQNPIEDVLNELEDELRRSSRQLDTLIMEHRHKLELLLYRAEKDTYPLTKSIDDAQQIEEMVVQLEETLDAKGIELENLCRGNSSVGNLKTFQRYVHVALSQQQAKQEDMRMKELEKEFLDLANKKIRESIQELKQAHFEKFQRPDGTLMNNEDFNKFQTDFNKRMRDYEEAKQKITTMEEEKIALKNTEAILQRQLDNISENLRQTENKAGVAGFHDAYSQLEHNGKETATSNELKSQNLGEISTMVQKIVCILEGKKKELEPKVQELKKARIRFQATQETYNSKKEGYSKFMNQIVNDNKSLETEVFQLQSKWIESERRYHLLCALDEILTSKVNYLAMEEVWRSGNESFLPDFRCLKDFYESTIIQQQGLTEELRRQICDMKDTGNKISNQMAAFTKMTKLLEFMSKHLTYSTADSIDASNHDAG